MEKLMSNKTMNTAFTALIMTVISHKVNKLNSFSKWWEGKQNGALADDLVNSFCGGIANNMLQIGRNRE